MKPFSLFDEIYGWNRAPDEPAVPLGKTVPGAQVDLLDATAPFSPLFDYQPSTGKAAGLVNRLHSDDLLSKVLGADLDDMLKAVRPRTAAASALDDVIARVSQTIVDTAMNKAVSVTAGAPSRKARIAAIVDKFRRELISKGYPDGVERFGAYGWDALQKHCEQYVSEAVAAA